MMKKRIGKAALCSLALCRLLCGCGTGEVTFIGEDAREQTAALEASEPDGESAGPSEEAEIYVYVCGAVNTPGVVKLREGSRAADALKEAGGFREDAGTDLVNLAAKLSDGEKLYIPTADEESYSQQTDSGLININTADAALLCTLPGIGESRAADIISYREKNGLFETCEDIMKVPGIKTSVYGKICDRITVK
ncbi:MAG: helix-hairpin-helix domain-containing protein [bacterium]|nr:helix-hairpin-helix domain-containing protein [bacterium]